MAAWKYGIGNLLSRAPVSPVAVSPAVEDTLLPLANLGSGYPDQRGAFQWRAEGDYEADLDLNLLAASSERTDAPTGWFDLLNYLAGSPGLPAAPPDWGTYAGRSALRLFRPIAQDVEVMPGEAVKLDTGLQLPGASTATGVRVRVVDLSTGKAWEASSTDDWTDDGVAGEQASDDSWLDVAETIAADTARTERTTYRVILEPVAASYGATTYVYVSAPALFAEVDLAAIVGHNLPAGATVELQPQPSGTAIALTPAQPSMYAVATSPVLAQVWRLSIAMPSALLPPPVLGEVWLGTARTLLAGSPVLPIGLTESAPGQLVLEAARKRKEVIPDEAWPAAELDLEFKTRNDAHYRQIRGEIARLTRFGADPLLLLPGPAFEGTGRVYHGRIADKVTYSLVSPVDGGSLRSFALPFTESPFASP
jgi:hypothetical protein